MFDGKVQEPLGIMSLALQIRQTFGQRIEQLRVVLVSDVPVVLVPQQRREQLRRVGGLDMLEITLHDLAKIRLLLVGPLALHPRDVADVVHADGLTDRIGVVGVHPASVVLYDLHTGAK